MALPSPENPIDGALWEEAIAKATRCLAAKIRDYGRALECIRAVLPRLRPGGDQPWDPVRYKLSIYIYLRAFTHFRNERAKELRRRGIKEGEPWEREIPMAADTMESLGHRGYNPLGHARVRENSERSDERWYALRDALASDGDAQTILELILGDVLKLRHQVRALGWPEPRARNARKRIRRAYDKIRYAPPSED